MTQIDDIRIDGNVPIPPQEIELRMEKWRKVALAIQVGESFSVPDGQDYREAANVLHGEFGYTVAVRKVGNLFRIWRTA